MDYYYCILNDGRLKLVPESSMIRSQPKPAEQGKKNLGKVLDVNAVVVMILLAC